MSPCDVAQIDRLASGEEFDLVIVGGGATGAGAALDAALRGTHTRDDSVAHPDRTSYPTKRGCRAARDAALCEACASRWSSAATSPPRSEVVSEVVPEVSEVSEVAEVSGDGRARRSLLRGQQRSAAVSAPVAWNLGSLEASGCRAHQPRASSSSSSCDPSPAPSSKGRRRNKGVPWKDDVSTFIEGKKKEQGRAMEG